MKKLLYTLLITSSLFAGYQAPLEVIGAKTIDTKEAYTMFINGNKFIDVRPIRFLKSGKIKDAIHIFVDNFTLENMQAKANKNENIIIYCNGRGCPLSSKAIIKLVSYGYKNIFYYRDGIPAWKFYKLPIE